MGRLHTRYSPVRRSPPEVLPLDLHVLGLSLAFILSQDQTLRCTIVLTQIFLLNLGFRLDVLLVFLLKGSFPRAAPAAQVSCAGLRLSKNLRFRLPSRLAPRSFRKRVQKYRFLQYE